MNMQNIQILFLLLDHFIKLAPWRIVTETTGRIGYAMSENLVRSLGVIAVIGVVLFAFPPSSIAGSILPAGDLGGAAASHVRIGPMVSIILFGFYLGLVVWVGLWLWSRSWRALVAVGLINLIDRDGKEASHV
jgi:hypothetical protein